MLSLKDFKKYEVKESAIMNITGGITCAGIDNVLNYLAVNNDQQFDAVVDQLSSNGVQCNWGNATCTAYVSFTNEAYNVHVVC
jgi:hypothetical protein